MVSFTISFTTLYWSDSCQIQCAIKKQSIISISARSFSKADVLNKRIIFLHHGKVIAAGSPIEITQKILEEEREEPALEEVFMRLVRGKAA